MKYLLLFEELKIGKTKKIYKHIDKGRGGAVAVLKGYDSYTGDEDHIDVLGDIFKKLVKRFKLNSKVKYLNSGAFGMAFDVGDDKVIKLTSNRGEAIIAKGMLGKNIPHCVNYYDVVFIKKYGVYAILMDRAEMFEKKAKEVVEVLTNLNIGQCNLKRVKRDLGHTTLSDNEVSKVIADYVKMYKSLTKSKVSLDDLHSDNMGYLKSKMVHFDMMGSSSYQDISKIKK